MFQHWLYTLFCSNSTGLGPRLNNPQVVDFEAYQTPMAISTDFWAGVSWTAFSGKEMWGTHWYLRRERMISYTLTMVLGIAAQGAATYCVFKYMFLQNHIEAFTQHVAHVHNNDIEAAGILSMVFPCLVLLVFNAEYFRLLFWPGFEQHPLYIRGKKATAIFTTCGTLATVIISTVIVSTRSASITEVDPFTEQQLINLYFRPPLKYNTWAQNIAWVVLLWIAVLSSFLSTAILLRSPDQEFTKEGLEIEEPIRNSIVGRDSGVASAADEKQAIAVSAIASPD